MPAHKTSSFGNLNNLKVTRIGWMIQKISRLSTIFQKQKDLSINSQDLIKIHVIEIKALGSLGKASEGKNTGGKYAGVLRDVVENTWRKYV